LGRGLGGGSPGVPSDPEHSVKRPSTRGRKRARGGCYLITDQHVYPRRALLVNLADLLGGDAEELGQLFRQFYGRQLLQINRVVHCEEKSCHSQAPSAASMPGRRDAIPASGCLGEPLTGCSSPGNLVAPSGRACAQPSYRELLFSRLNTRSAAPDSRSYRLPEPRLLNLRATAARRRRLLLLRGRSVPRATKAPAPQQPGSHQRPAVLLYLRSLCPKKPLF